MSFPRYTSYFETGVSWLGEVPSHWIVMPLGRLALSKCDGPFGSGLKSDHYSESGVRVIRLQNIREFGFDGSDATFIDPHYYETELGNHDVLAGDVLLAGLGDDRNRVGRACVAPIGIEPAMVKADCFRFRLDGRMAVPKYIALQLTAGAPFAAGVLATGSTRSRIPLSAMSSRRIILPPLAEQLAIAAFLDRETAKIDALVREQERLIALLKEKRQAAISHAVTKGLNPEVPTKRTGLTWPFEIPAHWEILPFTRVVRQFVDYRGATPTKVVAGVPLITATQVKQGRIDHSLDPVFISEDEYADRMTRGFPERGDVILTTEAPLGEVAQIEDERVAPGQRLVLLKIERSKIINDFLYVHFRSDFGKHQLLSRGTGSTAMGIRADRLRASLILVPPIREQVQIVRHLKKADDGLPQIEAEALRQIELLQERRNTLISAAVTGKIDVRDAVTVPAEAA
jgi:type I restriction enzyme, S subunit